MTGRAGAEVDLDRELAPRARRAPHDNGLDSCLRGPSLDVVHRRVGLGFCPEGLRTHHLPDSLCGEPIGQQGADIGNLGARGGRSLKGRDGDRHGRLRRNCRPTQRLGGPARGRGP